MCESNTTQQDRAGHFELSFPTSIKGAAVDSVVAFSFDEGGGLRSLNSHDLHKEPLNARECKVVAYAMMAAVGVIGGGS